MAILIPNGDLNFLIVVICLSSWKMLEGINYKISSLSQECNNVIIYCNFHEQFSERQEVMCSVLFFTLEFEPIPFVFLNKAVMASLCYIKIDPWLLSVHFTTLKFLLWTDF